MASVVYNRLNHVTATLLKIGHLSSTGAQSSTELQRLDYMTQYNLLSPGKFEWNFVFVIFKQILAIDGWGISCEITLIWMSVDFTDDHSTLAQVMAWCRQATSHYLSQCWPRSLSPYGVTRPQWMKRLGACHLQVANLQLSCSDLQLSCSDLTTWPSIRILATVMTSRQYIPLNYMWISLWHHPIYYVMLHTAMQKCK